MQRGKKYTQSPSVRILHGTSETTSSAVQSCESQSSANPKHTASKEDAEIQVIRTTDAFYNPTIFVHDVILHYFTVTTLSKNYVYAYR